MNRTVKLIVGSVVLGGLIAAGTSAIAQTTLTMSSFVPRDHHLTSVVLQGWAREVETATSSRVRFRMLTAHPSPPPGTFDAVRNGLVDLSYAVARATAERHVLTSLPELPGSGDTSLINSVAYSRIHWKHLHKLGEYKGVKLLGVFTHGPGQMFTNRPVTGINDVRGLKIRTGGGIAEAVARALGAAGFTQSSAESYQLLKSGAADGIFFPLESVVTFKIATALEQATLFPSGLYNSSFALFMNEDAWNKLSRRDQAAIDAVSGEHVARLAGQSWDEADRQGLDALKKAGVKIVEADAAFVAEVRKRSAPIVDDWIKAAGATGVDAARILAEFRAELKNVAAGR